jgi:hypothetical protein
MSGLKQLVEQMRGEVNHGELHEATSKLEYTVQLGKTLSRDASKMAGLVSKVVAGRIKLSDEGQEFVRGGVQAALRIISAVGSVLHGGKVDPDIERAIKAIVR